MDWVEGNMKKVHEATNGRVAYVYVPNTAGAGHEYFKRYFFPQVDKDAIIVDERFNGGGQVADYYIDQLRRPFTAHWATRYGETFRTPGAAIFGPKVMLIDETAGSGGDLLPWMFREYKLGPLVGKRTWGGLVGILGFPMLMDGGNVTAPNLAFWTGRKASASRTSACRRISTSRSRRRTSSPGATRNWRRRLNWRWTRSRRTRRRRTCNRPSRTG